MPIATATFDRHLSDPLGPNWLLVEGPPNPGQRPTAEEHHVSDVLAAAIIAALASVVGSLLTFIVEIRSVRRSVSTSHGEPLGRVLERDLTEWSATSTDWIARFLKYGSGSPSAKGENASPSGRLVTSGDQESGTPPKRISHRRLDR
jgi:hypothetical protein